MNKGKDDTKIFVFNEKGEELRSFEKKELMEQGQLDLNDLLSGIYRIQHGRGSKAISQKIEIKK